MARKVLIAAGAVGTAAAVGFVMQLSQGNAPQASLAAMPVQASVLGAATLAEPSVPERMEISAVELTSSLPESAAPGSRALAAPTLPPRLQPMPESSADRLPGAPPVASITQVPAEEAASEVVPAETATAPSEPDTPECHVSLTAETSAAALVTLGFEANCAPYTRVSFSHEGLEFGELTDGNGRIDIAVPALAETARFTATLPEGDSAEAVAEVSSLVFYDRIALQTEGRSGLTLHALEFGAGYDDEGHVWAGAPRDPAVGARGEGGFLMMLGDPALTDPKLAQVYSFPSATSSAGGDVALSVEAEVLRANCGTEVDATITQLRGGVLVGRQQVAIPMPGCDAVGDFLLLKTPLNDLKIASR